MEKTIFKNQIYYKILLVVLSILILWNVYALLTVRNYLSLITITVLSIVLLLIITKNKHAKIGLNIWTVLLIIGPTLSIAGKSIKIFLGDDIPNVVSQLVMSITTLICGLFIHHFNKTTVTVEFVDKPENK